MNELLSRVDDTLVEVNHLNEIVQFGKVMVEFIENQELCRLRWKEAEEQVLQYSADLESQKLIAKRLSQRNERILIENAKMKEELFVLTEQNKHLTDQLNDILLLLNDADPSSKASLNFLTHIKIPSHSNSKSTENEDANFDFLRHPIEPIETVPTSSTNYTPVDTRPLSARFTDSPKPKFKRLSVVPSDVDNSDSSNEASPLNMSRKRSNENSRIVNEKADTKNQCINFKVISRVNEQGQITYEPIPSAHIKNDSILFNSVQSRPPKTDVYPSLDNLNQASIATLNQQSFLNSAQLNTSVNPSISSPIYKPTPILMTNSPLLGEFEIVPRGAHKFSFFTNLKSVACRVCKNKIGSRSACSKCDYCNMLVHIGCKPNSSSSFCQFALYHLNKFTENRMPKVPRIIKYIIGEIEKRGLNEVGLYRISGSEKEVKEILEHYLDTGMLSLTRVKDVHSLTSLMKKFLNRLTEPLVTNHLRSDFINAAGRNDVKCLKSIYLRLPLENKHTLSAIIFHLKRVVEAKSNCMNIHNICNILTSTIVGSVADNKGKDAYTELEAAKKVMEALLQIEDGFYVRILTDLTVYQTNVDDANQHTDENARRTNSTYDENQCRTPPGKVFDKNYINGHQMYNQFSVDSKKSKSNMKKKEVNRSFVRIFGKKI